MISNNFVDSLHYLKIVYDYLNPNAPPCQTTEHVQVCVQSRIASHPVNTPSPSISSLTSIQKIEKTQLESSTQTIERAKEKRLFLFKVCPSQTPLQTGDIDHAFSILQGYSQEELFQQLGESVQWNDLYDKDNLFICMLRIGCVSMCNINMYSRTPAFIKDQGLSECECTKAVWRDKTESTILCRIESRFNDHKQMRTYVSIGSGECFQDWVILSKLILLGYTSVDIHLCDIEYGKGGHQAARQTIGEFFTNFPGITYTTYFHPSFRDFAELQKPADIVLALDFNGDIDHTLPPPKLLLSPDGFTYCSARCKKNQPHWDVADHGDHFFTYWLI